MASRWRLTAMLISDIRNPADIGLLCGPYKATHDLLIELYRYLDVVLVQELWLYPSGHIRLATSVAKRSRLPCSPRHHGWWTHEASKMVDNHVTSQWPSLAKIVAYQVPDIIQVSNLHKRIRKSCRGCLNLVRTTLGEKPWLSKRICLQRIPLPLAP